MPDKPVVLYIYGGDILPSYHELVELKILAEEKGQQFVLIPSPKLNEDGTYYLNKNNQYEPEIDVNSENYDLTYIKSELAKKFAEGKECTGENFLTIINTHGYTIFDGSGHKHCLSGSELDKDPDSEKLYEAVLDINGCLIGMNDLSCFSGAGIIGFNRALHNKVAEENKNLTDTIEFFASARPFQESRSSNTESFIIKGLKEELLERGKIDQESIERLYHVNMSNPYKTPTIKTIFYPHDLSPDWQVPYDNLETDLKNLYENFKKNGTFPSYEEVKALFQNVDLNKKTKDINLSQEEYDIIFNSIKLNRNYNLYIRAIPSHLYGELLALADKYPDKEAQKNNTLLDKTTFISYRPKCLYEINNWEKWVTPTEKEIILRKGAEVAADNYPRTCFLKSPVWSKAADEQGRKEILIKAAENDPEGCFLYFDIWSQFVNEETLKEILIKISEGHPGQIIFNSNTWSIAENDENKKEILKITAKNFEKLGFETNYFSSILHFWIPSLKDNPKDANEVIEEFLNSLDNENRTIQKKKITDTLKELSENPDFEWLKKPIKENIFDFGYQEVIPKKLEEIDSEFQKAVTGLCSVEIKKDSSLPIYGSIPSNNGLTPT